MKSNPLVTKRFQELADKAAAIADAKTLDFVAPDSAHTTTKSTLQTSAVGNSVLNLLQRIFGEDSIHFQHFSRNADNVGDSENAFQGTVCDL